MVRMKFVQRLRYARVIDITYARKEDGLIGSARMRAAGADSRAGWIKPGTAEQVERDDSVPGHVGPWNFLCQEGHRDRFPAHCVSGYKIHCAAGRMIHTGALPLFSGPVQLLTDLVDSAPLGGRAIEFFESSQCNHIGHKRISVMQRGEKVRNGKAREEGNTIFDISNPPRESNNRCKGEYEMIPNIDSIVA
jgi:hypothetical protein